MGEHDNHGQRRRIARVEADGIVLALLPLIDYRAVLWMFLTLLLAPIVLRFAAWPLYQRMLLLVGGRQSWGAFYMTLATA